MTPLDTLKQITAIKNKRCRLGLHTPDHASDVVLRSESHEKVDVVSLAADFVNLDANMSGGKKNSGNGKVKSFTRQYSLAKLGDKNAVVCERKDAMCLSLQVPVPVEFSHVLDALLLKSQVAVKSMLADRNKRSSADYPGIPCVISKSLIAKYQRNRKCKSVRNVVLPICGDKGRQIKIVDGGIRIPSIFKKTVIPVVFSRRVVGHIRGCELFKRRGQWFCTLQYDTPVVQELLFTNVIGVDRNSRGNVAVAAVVQTGKVRKFGPDAGILKKNYRNRVRRLQKKGKTRLLRKLSGKQGRRVKDINHKVSRSVVDYARETSSAIVLEDLSGVRKGKIRGYVEKSQWSFYQLEQMICYKAALSGIPVFFVPAAYTSKQCSRCGKINNPNGKKYCCECGHVDHRDANAGFNIGKRFCVLSGIPSAYTARPIGGPQACQCSGFSHVF